MSRVKFCGVNCSSNLGSIMRKSFFFFLSFFLLLSCSKKSIKPIELPIIVIAEDSFVRGVDFSFLPELEQYGTKFFSVDSTPSDALSILSAMGCNTVRVRVWVNPSDVHCSLDEVVSMVKRIKQNKMKVILDLHYSDTWADPGHQAKPAQWAGLSTANLTDSVYAYTQRVMNETQPEYVQIGNEINDGFLWNDGKITNQAIFIQLLKAGIQASRDSNPKCKVIIHYAGLNGAEWFYSILKKEVIDYDIIGLSYYPIWHGYSFDTLQLTIENLVLQTSKKVMVVETAYPFTLGWNDYTNNIVGLPNQLIPGYPASPQGQLDFMKKIRSVLEQNSKGAGFCYWGGEWVAFKGPISTNGSSYENQALFNFNNRALPVMQVFKK